MEASGFVDEVRVPSANALEKQTDNPRNGNAGTIDGSRFRTSSSLGSRQPAGRRSESVSFRIKGACRTARGLRNVEPLVPAGYS
jgi:hypothetical protein